MGMCCEKKTMIAWRNVRSMKWRVEGQEVDQRKLGERLWKKTVRHINWTERMPWIVINWGSRSRMTDDRDRCEWVNVSSGTGSTSLLYYNKRIMAKNHVKIMLAICSLHLYWLSSLDALYIFIIIIITIIVLLLLPRWRWIKITIKQKWVSVITYKTTMLFSDFYLNNLQDMITKCMPVTRLTRDTSTDEPMKQQ